MAQGPTDEFSPLWRRHLAALRDDFSAASIQAVPSVPSGSRSVDGRDAPRNEAPDAIDTWDDKIESVVEALDELILCVCPDPGGEVNENDLDWEANGGIADQSLESRQSPKTADTHSPGTPWFPDHRDGYTETALSSPLNSSGPVPRTAAAPSNKKTPNMPAAHADEPLPLHANDPLSKGKAHDIGRGGNDDDVHDPDSTVRFLLDKQLPPMHDYPYSGRYYPGSRPSHIASLGAAPAAPTTATTIVYSPTRLSAQKPPPSEVQVLMLSWAPAQGLPGLPTPDGSITLDADPDREALRMRLKARGYRVQCRAIPADDYPTAAVETILDRFLARSTPDTLLVVYYRGFGCLDREGRMLFSSSRLVCWNSGPGPDASSFFWDDVRDPIMQVPGDVLFVFDCTALPGTTSEEWEMRVEAGMASSASTKQLLGICVPPEHPSRDGHRHVCSSHVTQSLCRTLDRIVDVPVLSVHRLCSLMREDLRGTDLASRVFVSQLGGGQLLDIYLPWLAGSPRPPQRQNTTCW
ncbi:hypothetical protein VTJ49DRAFT_5997 [Mycothermus thermophilus]|uniref:Uncharacterized protein n=1 Tax=Humicola insolens TaxID=85995 RepID=A0ABR3VL57_HUMIN